MDKKNILKVAKDVLKHEAESIEYAGKNLSNEFTEIVEIIHQASGSIILTGMGKSGDIAKKISSTLASIGLFSYFLHPSEALHGDLGKLRDGDVIIVLSHSGETEEVLTLIERIGNLGLGAEIIAITANSTSPLARIAHKKLFTYVENEARKTGNDYFLTPTVSTTVTLALGDALACALQEVMDFNSSKFHRNHPGGPIGIKLSKSTNKD